MKLDPAAQLAEAAAHKMNSELTVILSVLDGVAHTSLDAVAVVPVAGAAWNLVWVTAGNIVGGNPKLFSQLIQSLAPYLNDRPKQ